MPEVQVLDKAQALEKVTKIDPTRAITMEMKKSTIDSEGNSLILSYNKKDYSVSASGTESMLKMLRQPTDIAKNVEEHPKLVANYVKYFLDRKDIAAKVLFNKNRVVGFTSPDALVIPNSDVIETITKVLPEAQFDHIYNPKDGITEIHCFNGNGQRETVAPGDYFKTGVKVTNSPTGIIRPIVSAYALRLVCTNGAVAMSDIWRAQASSEPEWLQGAVKGALSVAKKEFLDRIRALKDVAIDKEHIEELLGSIFEDLRIPTSLRETISRRIMGKGADNFYDLFNHFTYIGSHYEIARSTPRFITRLMQAGGALTHHRSVCGQCHRTKAER